MERRIEREIHSLASDKMVYLLDELLLRWLRAYNQLRANSRDLRTVEHVQREAVEIHYLEHQVLSELHARCVAPDLEEAAR